MVNQIAIVRKGLHMVSSLVGINGIHILLRLSAKWDSPLHKMIQMFGISCTLMVRDMITLPLMLMTF